MQNNLTFKLFGELALENPENHLTKDELLHLNKVLPLIQDLDQ